MKNIYDVRFENLLHLKDQFTRESGIPDHGSIKALSIQLDVTERYLGHLLARRKNIGSRTARKIEAALELPDNWMDVDQTVSANEKTFLDLAVAVFRAAPDDAKKELLWAFSNLLQSPPRQKMT